MPSKHTIHLLLILAALTAGLSSCAPKGEISLHADGLRLSNLEIKGSERATLKIVAKAVNDNPKAVRINEAQMKIWHRDTKLGILRLANPVRIPPRYNDTISLPLSLEFDSPASLLGLMLKGDIESTIRTMEGEAYVKGEYGGLHHTERFPRQPVEKLLSQLGI